MQRWRVRKDAAARARVLIRPLEQSPREAEFEANGTVETIGDAREVEELEERIAPSIVLANPAGNTLQGNGASNGQAIDNVNPTGYAPPGHNK